VATEVWMYQERRLAELDLSGFEVEARDGPIGRVVHSMSSADGAFLVVDPGPSMPLGRHVVIPAGLVDTVDLDDRRLLLQLSRDQVRHAPEYRTGQPLDAPTREAFGRQFQRGGEIETQPPAARERRAPRRQQSARGRAATPKRRRSRQPSGRASTSRRSGEKTRDELYQEARRLGIEGRSKMNKAHLSRAVGAARGRSTRRAGSSKRSGSARANPVEVQRFLEGVGYPVGTRELVAKAKSRRAKSTVRQTLERLPERRFRSPTEVSEAIGRLS
jgi:Protein of unknown function (DUF2795)